MLQDLETGLNGCGGLICVEIGQYTDTAWLIRDTMLPLYTSPVTNELCDLTAVSLHSSGADGEVSVDARDHCLHRESFSEASECQYVAEHDYTLSSLRSDDKWIQTRVDELENTLLRVLFEHAMTFCDCGQ